MTKLKGGVVIACAVLTLSAIGVFVADADVSPETRVRALRPSHPVHWSRPFPSQTTPDTLTMVASGPGLLDRVFITGTNNSTLTTLRVRIDGDAQNEMTLRASGGTTTDMDTLAFEIGGVFFANSIEVWGKDASGLTVDATIVFRYLTESPADPEALGGPAARP